MPDPVPDMTVKQGKEEEKMKRILFTVLALAVLLSGSVAAVRAEIIPPYGEGQIGLQAVVLCEELTLREKPDVSARAVKTLPYGTRISVTENEEIRKQSNGWAYCVLGDSEDATVGWVNPDYIVVDPAWYRTDGKTPVYAWNDPAAPKVALLDKDTLLPILKEDGDWLVVSLRGAVGWIRKTAAD